MIPDHVRNRRSGSSQNRQMRNVRVVVSDAAATIRRLSWRTKSFLLATLCLSMYIYGSLIVSLTRNHLVDDAFLQTDKCPACYGHSLCWAFKDNQIKLKGWSQVRLLDFVNIKNVHFAEHSEHGQTMVLKKLAHDKELDEIDEKLCQDALRPVGCDIARVLMRTNTGDEIRRLGLLPKHLKGTASMFSCPTYNLIDKVMESYKEKLKPDNPEVMTRDKLQLYVTAITNPEPLMLQTFPSSDGWPFPEYYGACGRFIAVSYEGEPLYNYYNAPWPKRADLAYQIMKIADRLTNGGQDFGLYMTDLNYENLVVDQAGKVTLIDLENIVVVDRTAIQRVKKPLWNQLHENRFDECDGKNCLTFSTEDLCSRMESDLNYYAVCRNLLSKYANDADLGMPSGLLHDMPNFAVDDWDLEHLLNECVHPTATEGRLKAKERIIHALENLRNVEDSRDAAHRIS